MNCTYEKFYEFERSFRGCCCDVRLLKVNLSCVTDSSRRGYFRPVFYCHYFNIVLAKVIGRLQTQQIVKHIQCQLTLTHRFYYYTSRKTFLYLKLLSQFP